MAEAAAFEGCSGISAGTSGAAETISPLWSSLWSPRHHGNLLPSPSASSALALGAFPAQSPKPAPLSHTHTIPSDQGHSLQVGKVQRVLPTRQCHLTANKHGATGCFYGNKHPIEPAAPGFQARSHQLQAALPEWSSAFERLPNQLCAPFPAWSQHHDPLGYPTRGKDTTSLPWMSPSAGPGAGSPADSQPGEQQQSWAHQSQSCAIGSLKSQAYLPIDLFSSVKLRKTQGKHKRTSPEQAPGEATKQHQFPRARFGQCLAGKNKTQFQAECQSQLKHPPWSPGKRNLQHPALLAPTSIFRASGGCSRRGAANPFATE